MNINKETNTVDFSNGKELKERGMQQAIDHAEEKIPTWAEQAYDFLNKFARDNRQFLTEDVRMASKDIVPEPPHLRAWGHIMVKAAREGIIHRIGFEQVKNSKAHRANASYWASSIYTYKPVNWKIK